MHPEREPLIDVILSEARSAKSKDLLFDIESRHPSLLKPGVGLSGTV